MSLERGVSRRFVVVASASATLSNAWAQGAPHATTSINWRISALADQYFDARADGVDGEPQSLTAQAARALDAKVGNAWGLIDAYALRLENAAALREAFAGLPDPVRRRDGSELSIRTEAIAFADVLIATNARHQADWHRREAALRRACVNIDARMRPRQVEAFAYVRSSLGLDDAVINLPVYLVTRAPAPGASTLMLRPDEAATVLSISEFPGTQLIEAVLHEATHAMDAAAGDGSVFNQLRTLLTARGADTQLMHGAPHAIMFVQAGETVRRFYDPAYVDYGDATGLYARLGRVADVVRDAWRLHLAGETTRDQALTSIANALSV